MSENGDSKEGTDAVRLKTLAEEKYTSGDLKSAIKYAKRSHRHLPDLDGLSEMLTAFKILRTATKPATAAPPDYYKILQVERFSHINGIKKQYKKLALTLHPDKHPFVACEEAFKLVAEAFRVLSDKIKRKEYDLKLRLAMQSAAAEEAAAGEEETFWTACSTCRLLHKFNRKYLGHNLMCPSCRKSFRAVEASENAENSVSSRGNDSDDEKTNEISGTRVSARIKARKMTSFVELLQRAKGRVLRDEDEDEAEGGSSIQVDNSRTVNNGDDKIERVRSRRGVERSRVKRSKVGEEESMTLAEMQMLVKKMNKGKLSAKENATGMKPNLGEKEHENKKEKATEFSLSEKESEVEEAMETRNAKRKREKAKELYLSEKESEIEEAMETRKAKQKREKATEMYLSENESEIEEAMETRNVKQKRERRKGSKGETIEEIMDVEGSDSYEFDNDRDERSFKKGQVWAVYNDDDDDGMPSYYALIDEVLSVNPFEVRLFWLDFENNGDDALVNSRNKGFHITCGRFKVSEQESLVKSLKKFSHIVGCERAARESYWIYPKKGTIWAIYDETNQVVEEKHYEIVVCLTSYTEEYGLSVAYLDKVDNFRSVFKRREIGPHTIRWLGKDNIKLMSHQIPARKFSGKEGIGISKELWELDPASVPPNILTIGGSK